MSGFIYGPDLDAIRTTKATGPPPYLLRNLALADLEKKMISELLAAVQSVTYPSDLDAIVWCCAVSLSIEYLPEVFTMEGDQPNAFNFGSEEQAYVVMDSRVLRMSTPRELMAVIAHELGHVRSGHVIYHTLAEVLRGGISLSEPIACAGVLAHSPRRQPFQGNCKFL